MAARPTPATVSIPRFLLPQLTWRAPHLRPAAMLPPSRGSKQQHGRQHKGRQHDRHQHNSHQHHERDQPHMAAPTQYANIQEVADWKVLKMVAAEEQQRRQGRAHMQTTKAIYRALRSSLRTTEPSPPSPWSSFGAVPRKTFASSIDPVRSFHTSGRQSRRHTFDTMQFVERLHKQGMSLEQAKGCLKVVEEAYDEFLENQYQMFCTREELEHATYMQKVDFAKLRSEVNTADAAEMAMMRADNERLMNEIAKFNTRLRDEINRASASARLDLNLDKGRIRDEAASQELKLKETESRIEQEVAAIRERVESVKFSTLQWLIGVATGTAAIILGVWRLFM